MRTQDSPPIGGKVARTPFVVRGYLLTHRLLHRLQAMVEAAFTGCWLGVLTPAQLHGIDYDRYARSATYGSDEHNRRGLFDWEEEAVGAHFADTRRLLVIGAGGGREMLALAKRGYEVDGYECNPHLVESGNELLAREGLPSRIRETPRDACPDNGRTYDGIVVGWSAYMLIPGAARRRVFLRQVRALLPEGGPVLVSFFTREKDTPRLRTVAAVGNAIRRVLRRERLTVGDDLAPNYVHRFTEEEIAEELRRGGFHMVRFHPQGRGSYDSGYAVGIAC